MKLNLFNKKVSFKDAPNTLCFTCCHILDKNHPIRYVSHDEDGEWQFLCGETHILEEARIVSLSEISRIDRNIVELSNLKCGECAEFINDKWVIRKKDR